jgi:hypothetical protein
LPTEPLVTVQPFKQQSECGKSVKYRATLQAGEVIPSWLGFADMQFSFKAGPKPSDAGKSYRVKVTGSVTDSGKVISADYSWTMTIIERMVD